MSNAPAPEVMKKVFADWVKKMVWHTTCAAGIFVIYWNSLLVVLIIVAHEIVHDNIVPQVPVKITIAFNVKWGSSHCGPSKCRWEN